MCFFLNLFIRLSRKYYARLYAIKNHTRNRNNIENFGAKKRGFNAFITGIGRYKTVEEKWRNNSVQFAGRNSATLNTYD